MPGTLIMGVKPVDVIPTQRIRNVVLVGHSGCGKTTLAEALLHRAGVIDPGRQGRRRHDGLDTEPEEIKRGMSLSLGDRPVRVDRPPTARRTRSTCIDTPGLRRLRRRGRSRRSASPISPVVVVSAVDGVEVGTELAWRAVRRRRHPADGLRQQGRQAARRLPPRARAAAVDVRARLRATRAAARRGGVAARRRRRAVGPGVRVRPDGTHHTAPLPDDVAEEEHRLHDEVVEEIVSGDDDQLERYLSGEVPTAAELERTLAHEVLDCLEFPVLVGSAITGVGIDRLADFICELGPVARRPPDDGRRRRPRRSRSPPMPAGQPLAYVFKTIADPFVGQVSLFKVLSGTIARRRPPGQQRDRGRGATARPVPPARQGAAAMRPRWSPATSPPSPSSPTPRTGTTLAPRGMPVRVVGQPPAPPDFGARAEAADADRRRQARRARCTGCWPRIRALSVDRNEETHQTVLRGTGDTHVAVALERLARKFGVQRRDRGRAGAVPRDRSSDTADAEGKVKKQIRRPRPVRRGQPAGQPAAIAARASSSSTRSSAARSRATTSRRCRRASRRR